MIGDIPLDDVLAKREEINHILRAKLDEVTERWGVKITSVEIREIVPPRDIQDAMNRQMSAERNRRAVITESEGTRQATINVAEGDKQSNILRAEGERQSQILRAEGFSNAADHLRRGPRRRREDDGAPVPGSAEVAGRQQLDHVDRADGAVRAQPSDRRRDARGPHQRERGRGNGHLGLRSGSSPAGHGTPRIHASQPGRLGRPHRGGWGGRLPGFRHRRGLAAGRAPAAQAGGARGGGAPAHPGDIGLAYEDVRFTTDDGYTLDGWLIPAGRETGPR